VLGKLPVPVLRNSSNGVTNSSRAASIPALPDSAGVNPWKAFAAASQGTILDLAQVYLEIVYPMYEFSVMAEERRAKLALQISTVPLAFIHKSTREPGLPQR
jgi:hypothetical protein